MKISLNGEWQLTFVHPETRRQCTIPGRVPGNVLADLHRAGLIPDPYFGHNSWELRVWEFSDFEYSYTFPKPAATDGVTLLRFDGVDTVAEVWLNGERVGDMANMFIEHKFEVTSCLQDGDNEIRVKLSSPITAARAFRRPPFSGSPTCEAVYLRRARHTYGWDIAPRLIGGGLWRGVSLSTRQPDRWGDTYLYTAELSPSRDRARMVLDWNFETAEVMLTGFEAVLTMRCGEARLERRFSLPFTTGRYEFDLESPRLWFPRGSGAQPLYDIELNLLHHGEVRDRRNWRSGIRTVRLERTEELDDSGSGKFQFVVNHTPIFVKGANWVPAEALHGEKTERIRQTLELFADANCNMVRCWGGGVYEDHDFFDFCDEQGLLVWQDFMFACETPAQEAWFFDQVREEAAAVIRKLRRHPSLAVWSGDNEVDEMFFFSPWCRRRPPSANRLNREVLRDAVTLWDPARDYLPSSPYLSDRIWQEGKRYHSPEQHLWGPRDDFKGKFYQHNHAIFVSEIGYHGMPATASVERFLPPASRNGRVGNPDWLCHAASDPVSDPDAQRAYRIRLMEQQVEGFFGAVPERLEEFVAASQIVQAEAFKFFIESFRMRKGERCGIIWWNMMDCWPQFSDAVVDYYFRRKLAYGFIRQSQQQLLLCLGEPEAWHLPLYAVNDRPEAVRGGYTVTDAATGEVMAQGEFTLPPDSVATLTRFPVSRGHHRMFLIRWDCNGEACCNHYLLGHPPFSLHEYTDLFQGVPLPQKEEYADALSPALTP